MRAELTMAASSPACWHSWRNTELSAWRAAAARPNETLEMPSTVRTPGMAALMSFMPSIVSMPSRRLSSMPGADRQREGIEEKVLGQQPVTPDGQVIDRLGGTQLSIPPVRAWPSVSMQVHTTAAP